MNAGFGTYFYLNRIKELISILFIATMVSCVMSGDTEKNTFDTADGGSKTTSIRNLNFNFGLFAVMSLVDNLSALGAAKKSKKKKIKRVHVLFS